MRRPRFEMVRTAAGWHARFRAANGQVVWVTESYTRRGAARNALYCLANAFGDRPPGHPTILVRTVDERTRP